MRETFVPSDGSSESMEQCFSRIDEINITFEDLNMSKGNDILCFERVVATRCLKRTKLHYSEEEMYMS